MEALVSHEPLVGKVLVGDERLVFDLFEHVVDLIGCSHRSGCWLGRYVDHVVVRGIGRQVLIAGRVKLTEFHLATPAHIFGVLVPRANLVDGDEALVTPGASTAVLTIFGRAHGSTVKILTDEVIDQ